MVETKEPSIDGSTLAKRGLVAIALSAVANFILLQAVLIPELVQQFRPLNNPSVVMFSILGAVGATIAYVVVDKLSDSPNRHFVILSAVVLVVSFVPDIALLGQPEATLPAVLVLMVMHVVVAAISVGSLTGRMV